MDFNYDARDEAFRAEVRAWLEANQQFAPNSRGPLDDGGQDDWSARVRWHKKLNEGGWVAVHWPKGYGGRGATGRQRRVFCVGRTAPGPGAARRVEGSLHLAPPPLHLG